MNNLPSNTHCPDLELLAALVDRRLEGEERDQVLEHVEGCEACYEVYTETIRFQREAEQPATVVTHPATARTSQRPRILLVAIAAVLLLAILVPVAKRLFDGDRPSASARLASRTDALAGGEIGPPASAATFDGSGWSYMRSGAGPELGREAASFRLGVRLLDLDLALETGRRDRADDLISEIQALLSILPGTEPVLGTYREMKQELDADTDLEGLRSRNEEASSLVVGFADEARFEIGNWAEASRIASSTGRLPYFDNPDVSQLALSLEDAGLPDSLQSVIRETLDLTTLGVTESRLPELSDLFTAILVEGGDV